MTDELGKTIKINVKREMAWILIGQVDFTGKTIIMDNYFFICCPYVLADSIYDLQKSADAN